MVRWACCAQCPRQRAVDVILISVVEQLNKSNRNLDLQQPVQPQLHVLHIGGWSLEGQVLGLIGRHFSKWSSHLQLKVQHAVTGLASRGQLST